MKQASLITLGCKVNSFDTALLWEGLEKRGFQVSDEIDMADIYVINTCTVTNNAGSQSRQVIRKVRRMNPDSLVIVTGCHAQVSPEEVSRIDGVDYVIGNQEKEQILDLIEKSGSDDKRRVHVNDIFKTRKLEQDRIGGFLKKSRAVLKVQDGCESFCSYCIIPYARGRSRSLPIESVREQVVALSENGFHEIVLTGIHLGGYGLDLPKKESLLTLIKMLDELPLDMRYRISSVEPTEINDEMLEFLVTSKRICRHLQVPLQSGDESILKAMGRHYNPSFYLEKLEKIASRWDGVSLGIDVISGFPGEDEAAFMNSYRLISDSPAAYLHVFPYSRRDGTPAAAMESQVDSSIIKERCARLRSLGETKKKAFCRSFTGKRLSVVKVEEKGDLMKTLSDNYIEIFIEGFPPIERPFFDVRPVKMDGVRCYGEPP